MITTILRWLTGGGIAAIGKELNRAIEIREAAKNDAQRIEADKLVERLRAERDERLAQMSAQRDVLKAEQGRWLTAWIRPALAVPVVLVVFHMALSYIAGRTIRPMPDELFWIVTAVVSAYLLTRPLEKIFRK